MSPWAILYSEGEAKAEPEEIKKMKIDPNTKAFKLVKFQANYHVYQVAANGATLQLLNNNQTPVVVGSVIELRNRLGRLSSKGLIPYEMFNLPIGF